MPKTMGKAQGFVHGVHSRSNSRSLDDERLGRKACPHGDIGSQTRGTRMTVDQGKIRSGKIRSSAGTRDWREIVVAVAPKPVCLLRLESPEACLFARS